MKWAHALSSNPVSSEAVAECVATTTGATLESPQVAFVFATPDHADHFAEIGRALRRAFPEVIVAGCTGHLVAGRAVETEGPALALLVGAPGYGVVHALRVHPLTGEFSAADEERLRGQTPVCALVFADPFTCDADELVSRLDERWPACSVVGGLASGGTSVGENRFLCGAEEFGEGGVAVLFDAPIQFEVIVAPGCRPVGRPWIVTQRRGNVIHRFEDRTPSEAIADIFRTSDERTRELIQHSLLLGVETNREVEFDGRYLVRNLLGIDDETGALAVAAQLEDYQAVRFHVRDAIAADSEIRAAATGAKPSDESCRVAALLQFSCLGRGEGLYGAPNHDAAVLSEILGAPPAAGFFCNGEIGPAGDRTRVHGFTTVALAIIERF